MKQSLQPFKPKTLYHGYDALDVAFQGRVSEHSLTQLESAKAKAKEAGADILETIGAYECQVKGYGTSAASGYTYLIGTGAEGIAWSIKKSRDVSQWNLRASVSSSLLQAVGFEGAVDRLYSDLKEFGAQVLAESVARVDYCVDMQLDSLAAISENLFRLDPDKFIAHSRVSRTVELGDHDADYVRIFQKKYVETVTLGKMPGRQLQVYNKRIEQVAKKSQRWFAVWGFNSKTCPNVWRVEVRAGKNYLREWNVKTFQDVRDSFGDLCADCFANIRYVESTDYSNISRAPNHAFWAAAEKVIMAATLDNISGICRGRMVEMRREDARAMYDAQTLGLIVSGAVVRGAESVDDLDGLADYVANLVRDYVKYEGDKVLKTMTKTKARLVLLDDAPQQEETKDYG